MLATIKTASLPFKDCSSSFLLNSAAFLPTSGDPDVPSPLVSDFPIEIFLSALTKSKCCESV
jgi:hypothetical protein